MNSYSQTLKWDISTGSPEDNLSFIKQVELDLSNESAEDRRNGNHIKLQISWIATLSKFTWMQDQDKVYIESTAMIHGRSTNCCIMQILLYLRFNMKHETYDRDTISLGRIRRRLQCSPTKMCRSMLVWMGQLLPSMIRIFHRQWRACKHSHRV